MDLQLDSPPSRWNIIAGVKKTAQSRKHVLSVSEIVRSNMYIYSEPKQKHI